jgi:hypothetical protein
MIASKKLIFQQGELILQPDQNYKKKKKKKYMSMVRLGASRCANLGWKMYDEQFRLRKTQDPACSWSLVDYELWLIYMNIIQNSKLNSNWIIIFCD